jgi:anti-sigma factor NepR-like protein
VSSGSSDKGWRFTLKTVQARQRRIGAQLERLWAGVLREPIPDEMLELLKKLDEKDRGKADA